MARSIELFHQFIVATTQNRALMPLGLPERGNVYEDVFLEYPELLGQLNVENAPITIQNYYARAVIKLLESSEDFLQFERFLMSRRGKLASLEYRYLNMCAFYSHDVAEFAAVLSRMTVIPMHTLLDFLFSSLAHGNENAYLSVIHDHYVRFPMKFRLGRNFQYYQLPIGPFYKYFEDDRMLTLLQTEEIDFKPLSVEDVVTILKYPKMAIPHCLLDDFRYIDLEVINSALVSIKSMEQMGKFVDVFGIRIIEESIKRDDYFLTPASKLITFKLLYQYKPSLLDHRE